jgi:hypothetical protein
MPKIEHALQYVEEFNLSTERLSKKERQEMWKEVASSEDNRMAHAEALAEQITNEIAAVIAAAKDNNILALEELATAVLTRTIVWDVLKENIASLVMEVRQLEAFENPFYTVRRLNTVTMVNNHPTMGATPIVQVGHQNDSLPIMTSDNRTAYGYSTRNALLGQVNERDEAANEIRRALLENRERKFIALIRNVTACPGPGQANTIPLPEFAMANDTTPDINNVIFDKLSNGLTKRNLSELMFKLEQYGYEGKTVYISPRRKADVRGWVSAQVTTSSSPVDFFTQREIITSGKMGNLYGLEIKVLNYLKDDEVYIWDNSKDFGEIFLRGEVQIEDRISTEGAFMRELHAAQNEGMVLYNARRLAKLSLTLPE